mmetsp:Transcript_38641/g.114792  ORF Transcript_38641/g.114792 Transcript_38641/m.114792 type:complete len:229 (+) Transcript_38641:1315-2001(+)
MQVMWPTCRLTPPNKHAHARARTCATHHGNAIDLLRVQDGHDGIDDVVRLRQAIYPPHAQVVALDRKHRLRRRSQAPHKWQVWQQAQPDAVQEQYRRRGRTPVAGRRRRQPARVVHKATQLGGSKARCQQQAMLERKQCLDADVKEHRSVVAAQVLPQVRHERQACVVALAKAHAPRGLDLGHELVGQLGTKLLSKLCRGPVPEAVAQQVCHVAALDILQRHLLEPLA